MKTRILLAAVSLGLAIILLSACGAPNQPSSPTPTSTRTPRPTFTPQPESTDTPTRAPATNTPAATTTPKAADTSVPTNTAVRPTATARPANTQPPPPPTAIQFPVFLDGTLSSPPDVRCPTGSTYEVVVYMKRQSGDPRLFVGGYVIALVTQRGEILNTSVTKPDGSQDAQFYGSCPRQASNDRPLPYNGKVDAADSVRAGVKPIYFRVIKSATDSSPLSKDYLLDFATPAQYWLYYSAP